MLRIEIRLATTYGMTRVYLAVHVVDIIQKPDLTRQQNAYSYLQYRHTRAYMLRLCATHLLQDKKNT